MKVKGSQLAQTAGVGNSAITNNVKRGNLIRDEKKFFDLDNPVNRDWCARNGINPDTCEKIGKVKPKAENKKQSKKKPPKNQNKKVPSQNLEDESDFDEISGLPEKMLNMTIRQLVMRYGGPMQLKGYVDILDKIMAAQKKDVDIQEKRKDLVPRQFVEFLKAYINTYNSQLLDFAEGCTSEIISLIKADQKKAKIEVPKMLRKEFSKLADETIKRINKEIKNLKVDDESGS